MSIVNFLCRDAALPRTVCSCSCVCSEELLRLPHKQCTVATLLSFWLSNPNFHADFTELSWVPNKQNTQMQQTALFCCCRRERLQGGSCVAKPSWQCTPNVLVCVPTQGAAPFAKVVHSGPTHACFGTVFGLHAVCETSERGAQKESAFCHDTRHSQSIAPLVRVVLSQ